MHSSLQLRQRQTLTMNPILYQSLKILQMPTIELEQVIKQEILQNPMLEVEEPDENVEESITVSANDKEKNDPRKDEIDWEEYFNNDFDSRGVYQEYDDEREFTEKVPTNNITLQDYLFDQWSFIEKDDEEKSIGNYIIGNIDDNGYLTCSVEEISQKLEVSQEKVEKVLKLIQTLEPIGVGARNLKECLMIQIKAKGLGETLAAKLIDEYWDDLERKRYSAIIRKTKISNSDLQKTIDLITTLNPKPGLAYSNDKARYIIPDLIVEKVGNDYLIFLNDQNVPRVRVNTAYKDILLSKSKEDASAKEYVESKLNSARWLVKTIEQRRKTMLKVMSYIVKTQKEFFEKGISAIKPMRLQDVADAIGMHESTISRVTTDKYVQTPQGVFELKYFFSTGVGANNDEKVSSKIIKNTIAKLIENEDKYNPLSDDQITKLLAEQGINIARRTVVKYRKQLGILPVRLRRKLSN